MSLSRACSSCSASPTAAARSLEAIRQRGALTLCAHPNALPFASKRGAVSGFQVEIARELAKRLEVSLEQQWVINSFQYRRAGCDIVLDAIADRGARGSGLRMSRPYHRSGVPALAVGAKSGVASLADLQSGQRVGVQVGSIASMILSKQGIETSPFAFEDDIMEVLAKGESKPPRSRPPPLAGSIKPIRMDASAVSRPSKTIRT